MQVGTVLGEHGEKLDQGLAWVFAGPCSYTGEDTVEISAHGSLIVLEALVRAALSHGAVLAGPGEFTRRAFLNGKIDLLQAEGVVDLIHAVGRFSLGNAYGMLSGQLSASVGAIGEFTLDALALAEALLDFPDDVPSAFGEIDSMVCRALARCAELTGTFETFSRKNDGVEVAIVGPPNAGKSSLFNLLLRDSRAIVSPVPGTTRDLIEARLFLDGELFRLVDTAGLRPTADPVEAEGVSRAMAAAQRADLVLVVMDASIPWIVDIGAMLERLDPKRVGVVFNKVDLPLQIVLPEDLGFTPLRVSALLGDGVDLLLDFLRSKRGRPHEDSEAVSLTRVRHFECLSRAEVHFRNALVQLNSMPPALECVAEELRGALAEVHSVLGVEVGDVLLDRIFSEFCIGK